MSDVDRARDRRDSAASDPASDLEARFADHLRASGCLDGASAVMVAVSGGLDSMTLLHLMCRSDAAPAVPVHAAHVDHRMREGSAADAEWVAMACAEWRVPCRVRRAPDPVRTEAEGRAVRYRFLEEARSDLGPGAVALTAHTADDQAETVLFRAARGSGVHGLTGIQASRTPSLFRPLLPFRRAELAEYAAARRVPSATTPPTATRAGRETASGTRSSRPSKGRCPAPPQRSPRWPTPARSTAPPSASCWTSAWGRWIAGRAGRSSAPRPRPRSPVLPLGPRPDPAHAPRRRPHGGRGGPRGHRGAGALRARVAKRRRIDVGGGVIVERARNTVCVRGGPRTTGPRTSIKPARDIFSP